jgi:WhiB family redox-sensing transcriptional regulator
VVDAIPADEEVTVLGVVEVFFAIDEPSQQEAVAICETCPVRAECLEHALIAREQYGVWGGVREQDRKRLARRRREAA